MPDNIAVSAGTGTSVATDQVGSDHYQRVKISDGTADSVVHLKVVAEDAAHTGGDTGLVLMAVRQDTAAALATTDGDYIPLIVDGSGRLWVDVGASALPTGAATAANQTTLIGHVDGVETLLGTIDADTSTLAGAVAGTEMQVDVLTMPTVTVTGTVTASGPLTDTQLRNTAVPVSVATLPALTAGTAEIGKLAAGTANIGDVDVLTIAAGDNNIGNVDIATIAAGETLIGLVGASDIVVTITPTVAAEAHTANDLLFDSTEIANAVRVAASTAIVENITIVDIGDQKAAITLIFANAATDFGAPGGVPDPDDTEILTVIGHVAVAASDYVDLGGASVACIRNVGLLLKAAAATTSIWLAGVTTGTPTPASASDLKIAIGLLRS